jgi:hypothetical protein
MLIDKLTHGKRRGTMESSEINDLQKGGVDKFSRSRWPATIVLDLIVQQKTLGQKTSPSFDHSLRPVALIV